MTIARLIATAALLGVVGVAHAAGPPATLQGTVLEKGTRRPLEGVTIFVPGDESLTTLTDADGRFSLDVPAEGEYAVAAAAMGFLRPSPRPAVAGPGRAQDAVVLYLEPVYAMDEVIVQAERNPERTGKVSVSGKELTAVPGAAGDPFRAIQALPGITTADDGSSAPAMRGSGPENNASYVDFLPVGYLFHLGGLESAVNGDLVEDFNVYRSSFGPEFADVTGGVIDVRLRDPRTDRLGAKVNVGLLESGVLVEGPIAENTSFFLAGRRSYVDLLLPKTGEFEDGVDYTQFPRFYDYQGKFLWRISDDSTLSLTAGGAGDEMGVELTEEANAVVHDPILAGSADLDVDYHSQGLLLTSRLTPTIVNRLGLSHMATDLRQELTQVGHAKVAEDAFLLRDQATLQAGDRHEVLFGLEAGWSRTALDLDLLDAIPSDFAVDPDYTSAERVTNDDTVKSRHVDLALRDRWRFHERGVLSLGAHGSYESHLGQYRVEPRVALEVAPERDTLLTAGWGRYHQSPQGHQMIDGLGNPDLNFEEAEHLSVGVERQFPRGWSARLEGYRKEFSELVVPHDPENYLNGGRGTAYGAELLLKKSRTADWSGWVSVAYAKTERENELTGEKFPYRFDQPVVINLVYEWNFARHWTFGAKWRYQSGAPFTPVTGSFTDPDGRVRPVYGELGSERLPAYHRLDLRFAREFLFDRWTLSVYLDIINAYARLNVAGYEYSADYSSREEVGQLPFIPAFGISAEF